MPRDRNYTNDGLHVPVRPGIFKLIGHEAYVCGPPGRPGGRKYKSLEEALAATSAAKPGRRPRSPNPPKPPKPPEPPKPPKPLQPGKRPALVLGQWSPVERVLLDDAVEAERRSDGFASLGTWARIAAQVPGRSARQCAERYRFIRSKL